MANNLNNRLTSVENKLNILDKSTDAKFIYIQGQNRTINSVVTDKISTLEERIKLMEESLQALQKQYDENNKLLDKLRPVVGKKRKWWQVI
jgi:hypothetical protein